MTNHKNILKFTQLWFVSAVIIVLSGSIVSAETPTNPCVQQSTNKDMKNIIDELFVERIKRLVSAKVLPKNFIERVEGVPYFICSDRNFEAAVLPNGVVKFDDSLINAISSQSGALLLGQYLHLDFSDVPITALYEELLTFALMQNLYPNMKTETVGTLISKISNGRGKIKKYITHVKFNERFGTLFLHGLGFMVLHEQCHVALQHNKTAQRDKVNQEYQADLCAIEIVSKHEEVTGGSPGAAFLGAMTMVSTQMVFDQLFTGLLGEKKFLENRLHPSPADRLEKLSIVVKSELMRRKISDPRFYDTIDGMYVLMKNLKERFENLHKYHHFLK
ncbi:MAG: hypothetical protein COC24_005225 [Alphaproteobacteria bacterium]|nr:hypothetical protein [Alphaproteobacteria bacterium]